MDYTEVAGKVIAVGDVAVKGQYKISKLRVVSKVLGTVELSVFVDDVMDVLVGQEIVCKVAPKDYKGKPQYACQRKYIKVFGSAIPVVKDTPVVVKKDTPVDWDSKELRMVRMNCLNRAMDKAIAIHGSTGMAIENKNVLGDMNELVEGVYSV